MGKPKAGSQAKPLGPVINVSMIGELNVYSVHEHELDRLAEGAPAGLAFDGAIAFASIGLTLMLTLSTTEIRSWWLFNAYLFICILSIMQSIVLFMYWFKTRRSIRALVSRIKSRMPAPPGIQEPMPADLGEAANDVET